MAGASGGRKVGDDGLDRVRADEEPAEDEAWFTVKCEELDWDGCEGCCATAPSNDCIPSVLVGTFGVTGSAALSLLGVAGIDAGGLCGDECADEWGDCEPCVSISS
jgi:hypothetical protein